MIERGFIFIIFKNFECSPSFSLLRMFEPSNSNTFSALGTTQIQSRNTFKEINFIDG